MSYVNRSDDFRGGPARTLIPLMPDSDNETLLRLAGWLARSEPVLLLGVVPVPEGENLSAGQELARQLRDLINEHVDRVNLRALSRIRVCYTPWEDIRSVLAKETSIRNLVLNWPHQLEAMRLSAAELVSHPPCDVILVRGPLQENPESFLVPMRGGPHAENALRLTLKLAEPHEAKICSLRIYRKDEQQEEQDVNFAGIALVLAELPQVQQETAVAADMSEEVLAAANQHDVVVLGTAAFPTESTHSFGMTTDRVLAESSSAVIAIKTKRVEREGSSKFTTRAISVLVDRWFAENTFHADEFADLNQLMEVKEERGLTISLALPALNEEKTVGDIIYTAKRAFVERAPLIDEIVLMDSNSTDRTREIAEELGIPVYIHQEVLPQYGARDGKGDALWKSLYVTKGDILLWVDTDVENFHPRFIYGLIGPLLHRSGVEFVKGFYRRPLRGKSGVLHPGRGGRVTELTVRPLLNLFYPELSGIVQPLAGEYGGRRDILEQLIFTSGYGVETCLLVEVFEKFKLASIAQVDLEERIHRNQPLDKLSQMSFAIVQALFAKLERRYGLEMVAEMNRSMKTMHYEPGNFYLEVEEIAELERPPMVEIPEYRRRHGLSG